MWEKQNGSGIINVFYKESNYTKEWIAKNPSKSYHYFDDEDREHYDNYILSIAEINEQLAYENRVEIFASVQEGKQVINSDLYKCYIHIPLIKYMNEKRLHERTVTIIKDHCKRNASESYFVHWFIRFYLISKYPSAATKYFSYTDTDISNYIKDNNTILMSTHDDLLKIEKNIEIFNEILCKINKKFGPIPLFALFAYIVSIDVIVNEEEFITNIRQWIKNQPSCKMKLWINNSNRHKNAKQERIDYFNNCIGNYTDLHTTCVNEITPRKKLTHEDRLEVWSKTNKYDCELGRCYICRDIIDKYRFEVCHLIAKANCGKDELDNLIAGCVNCNRRMGTEDVETYKSRMYPDIIF
jgi:5-methylcytosine-specific restriction endonuclease McrA